jgi:ceramide glucosyltransferase
VCQPIGWFTSLVTHVTLWGLLTFAATGGAAAGWLVLGLAARLGGSAAIMALLGDYAGLRAVWLVPVKDILTSTLWTASWFGRHVTWRDRRYRLAPDGRLFDASVVCPDLDPAPAIEPRLPS